MDIAKNPFSPITERYKRLKWNYRKGNRVKNDLIKKNLIKPVKITIKDNRWIKLFEITPQGREALQNMEIFISLRKGGIKHQYWVRRVAQHFRKNRYEVETEKPIGDGKTIDLVVRKGDVVKAVEVETGKSDVEGNIRKCVEAGYKEVLCVVLDRNVISKIDATKIRCTDRKIEVVYVRDLIRKKET